MLETGSFLEYYGPLYIKNQVNFLIVIKHWFKLNQNALFYEYQ